MTQTPGEKRRQAKARIREERRDAWQEAHRADLENRRLARASERASRRDEYFDSRNDRDDDAAFERRTAHELGMSVEDFRSLQQSRRAEIGDRPAISFSPDHKVR